MRKFVTVFLIGLILINITLLSAHEQTWPGRRLAKVWPEAHSFVKVQRTLSTQQIARIEKLQGSTIFTEDRTPVFYYAYETFDKKKRLGLILFLDAYGQNGKMEISLGMNPDGKVEKIHFWQHSEGKRLNSEESTKQFRGKTFLDLTSLKTSDAVTLAIRRGLLITAEAFGVNVETKGQENEAK